MKKIKKMISQAIGESFDIALDIFSAVLLTYLLSLKYVIDIFKVPALSEREWMILFFFLVISSYFGEMTRDSGSKILRAAIQLVGVFFLLHIVIKFYVPIGSPEPIGAAIFLQTLFSGFVGIRKK